jgi:ubiquinone/menaquinone biosynthesis C-methylase UbiE
MTDSIIQQQIAYYRARAGEYDEWFYRLGRYDRGEQVNAQWFAEVEIVMQALHNLSSPVDGGGRAGVKHVLELAAGTGIWTQELLKIGQHITAIDASPEVIYINRQKLNASNVEYIQADLFAWQPNTEYDLVFFGFWLSHVLPEQVDAFLSKVYRSLRVGGQFFMVDSLPDNLSAAKDNAPYQPDSIYHTRKLNDGSEYQIVKVFYKPAELQAKFEQSGFDAAIKATDHYFIYGYGTKRG